MSLFEWAVIAFIAGSILYHVWRGGSRNPESTGSLGRKVTGLSSRVSSLASDFSRLNDDVEALQRDTATTKDVARLEERMKGQAALAERTYRSVDRIERYLIDKGLSGK